jgi:hypothetical protein
MFSIPENHKVAVPLLLLLMPRRVFHRVTQWQFRAGMLAKSRIRGPFVDNIPSTVCEDMSASWVTRAWVRLSIGSRSRLQLRNRILGEKHWLHGVRGGRRMRADSKHLSHSR